MNTQAKWICSPCDIGTVSPEFVKNIKVKAKPVKATARVSAMGLYHFEINGDKVGNGVLTPGFTSYPHRVLYQVYDVTDMLAAGENKLSLLGGGGWAVGHFGHENENKNFADNISVTADIEIEYAGGETEHFVTDTDWSVYTSCILLSELYHGENRDCTAEIRCVGRAVACAEPMPELERQTCGLVTEHERFAVKNVIRTPKGELVLDFGQNIAGYVEVKVKGKRGEKIVISHAETLDADGNFYTDNLREAKNRNTYVLSGGEDTFKPLFSYQGFRYIRLDECPATASADSFTAVAIYTDMARTGYFTCGNEKINRLYENIVWGQKGNYVDIPTDCPQRDERLGWTADAQVFCRTGAINFNVEAFFDKWLRDMALEQREDGAVYRFVPYYRKNRTGRISAGWSDAAAVVPWEIYRAYGNRQFLEKYYPMMTKWIDWIRAFGDEEYLWVGGDHYGDWLAADAGEDSYYGATQTDLIASAYYAHSVSLAVKAGRALGKDTSKHEELLKNIKKAFRKAFMKNGKPVIYPKADAFASNRTVKADTQTACAMILCFELCTEEEKAPLAAHLAELIKESGGLMTTGFLGTPLLLHALAQNGYADVAYSLLFEERCPSWLYSVNHGATTVWEHWNGIKEDGSFWSADMNSFNHYAYGSVFDWIFEYAVGVSVCKGGEGYSHIRIAPVPDKRLGFVNMRMKTVHGEFSVNWKCDGNDVLYDICIPHGMRADICINGRVHVVGEGTYRFYGSL